MRTSRSTRAYNPHADMNKSSSITSLVSPPRTQTRYRGAGDSATVGAPGCGGSGTRGGVGREVPRNGRSGGSTAGNEPVRKSQQSSHRKLIAIHPSPLLSSCSNHHRASERLRGSAGAALAMRQYRSAG